MEVLRERPAVDVEIPTAAGSARAHAPAVAERHMPVLTAGPCGSAGRTTVDDQGAADPYLDDEVQRGPCSGCCASAGFGDSAERCVVADEQRESSAGYYRAQIDRAPPESRGL